LNSEVLDQGNFFTDFSRAATLSRAAASKCPEAGSTLGRRRIYFGKKGDSSFSFEGSGRGLTGAHVRGLYQRHWQWRHCADNTPTQHSGCNTKSGSNSHAHAHADSNTYTNSDAAEHHGPQSHRFHVSGKPFF
jgi:hypothetical protein